MISKTHAALVLFAGLFINGMVMAAMAYEKFIPRNEMAYVLKAIEAIDSKLNILLERSR